jgi:hypothetical protein
MCRESFSPSLLHQLVILVNSSDVSAPNRDNLGLPTRSDWRTWYISYLSRISGWSKSYLCYGINPLKGVDLRNLPPAWPWAAVRRNNESCCLPVRSNIQGSGFTSSFVQYHSNAIESCQWTAAGETSAEMPETMYASTRGNNHRDVLANDTLLSDWDPFKAPFSKASHDVCWNRSIIMLA